LDETHDVAVALQRRSFTTIANCREASGSAGHRFQTKSDTEVLFRIGKKWGEGNLARRIGRQFAFAPARICVNISHPYPWFSARPDRWGIQAAYYPQTDEGFAFAFEASRPARSRLRAAQALFRIALTSYLLFAAFPSR